MKGYLLDAICVTLFVIFTIMAIFGCVYGRMVFFFIGIVGDIALYIPNLFYDNW